MKEFYNTNADFKKYVDRYCVKERCSVDDALEHALVKEVANYYGKSGNSTNKENSVYVAMGECK